MKKFIGNVFRFALRNLVLMVCLVLLGVWFFPRNNYYTPVLKQSMKNFESAEESFNDVSLSLNKADNFSNFAKKGTGVAFIGNVVSNTADALVSEGQRKVIKNASLQIEVDETEITRSLVEEKVKELEGIVINMSSYEVRNGILAYNMTLRVPSEKLDEAMENIASLGVKKSESFSSNDITAQYMDTANLIKNLEIRRDRLREMMKIKTDKLSDVLEIDRELSNVQNKIENYERTQKKRDLNVAYSTINLNIQPKTQIGDFSSPHEWNLENTWKNSVNDLIHSLQNIAEKAVRIAVYAPIWLPVLLVLWFIQKKFRHATDKKTTKKSTKK